MSDCPLDCGCYSGIGNCKFCSQKMDCILMAILQKVESIELVLEKMAGKTA